MRKIYIAAPLFSIAEIDFNEKLSKYLVEEGYNIFLPQKECEGKTDTKEIFETCKIGIDSAEIVVAILDGADADSGTCWECGYAFAQGKKIIAVRTDFRMSGDTGGFNAMLFHSANKVITGKEYLSEILNYLKTI